MKNVLFLQSWYSHSTDGWYSWLENELKKNGYSTNFPDIAEFRSNKPILNAILKEIEKLNIVGDEPIVIGHSLGSLVALRLAEKHSFHHMILVSGWDFDDLTKEHELFWKTKINHEAIKQHVSNVSVIHSDNDPYITAFQAEEMSHRLNGKFYLVPHGGHFTDKDGIKEMPKILEVIE